MHQLVRTVTMVKLDATNVCVLALLPRAGVGVGGAASGLALVFGGFRTILYLFPFSFLSIRILALVVCGDVSVRGLIQLIQLFLLLLFFSA